MTGPDVWIDGIAGLPYDAAKLRKLQRVVRNRQAALRTL